LKWQVVLTEAAERDINAAAVWYENESLGLGREFLDAIAVSLQ
jgi:plasmid stabilization system protein ParE